MTFLADTNIFGELARPRPNKGVTAWADQVAGLEVSVITLEEVHYGLSWRPNDWIRSWFERFLAETVASFRSLTRSPSSPASSGAV